MGRGHRCSGCTRSECWNSAGKHPPRVRTDPPVARFSESSSCSFRVVDLSPVTRRVRGMGNQFEDSWVRRSLSCNASYLGGSPGKIDPLKLHSAHRSRSRLLRIQTRSRRPTRNDASANVDPRFRQSAQRSFLFAARDRHGGSCRLRADCDSRPVRSHQSGPPDRLTGSPNAPPPGWSISLVANKSRSLPGRSTSNLSDFDRWKFIHTGCPRVASLGPATRSLGVGPIETRTSLSPIRSPVFGNVRSGLRFHLSSPGNGRHLHVLASPRDPRHRGKCLRRK